MLDTVSASTEVGMLSRVYEVTLRALKEAHNDRLWFSTLCKKGRLLVLSQDWDALATLVADLHACVCVWFALCCGWPNTAVGL